MQISAMDDGIGFAEMEFQLAAERHAQHFIAGDAVHHDDVFGEMRDVVHRLGDLQPVKHAVGIGTKLDTGADLGKLRGLFQNDAAAPFEREHSGSSQAANAAAGNDDGFRVSHASLFCLQAWRCRIRPTFKDIIMANNQISVDDSQIPANIAFSKSFNVAVPLIDRHLDEGRGDKIAIQGDFGTVSYAQLAENVNRCGNALASLGLAGGDRVLMMVKDCPEFFYIFWGAIKAGFVPVPLNTLLRANDYQFMIEDSGCAAVIYSPEYAGEVEPALASAATENRITSC